MPEVSRGVRAVVAAVLVVLAAVRAEHRRPAVSADEAEAVLVERLLRKPPKLACAELGRLLDRGKHLPPDSIAREQALSDNAHLITAIREAATARGVTPPWLAAG